MMKNICAIILFSLTFSFNGYADSNPKFDCFLTGFYDVGGNLSHSKEFMRITFPNRGSDLNITTSFGQILIFRSPTDRITMVHSFTIFALNASSSSSNQLSGLQTGFQMSSQSSYEDIRVSQDLICNPLFPTRY